MTDEKKDSASIASELDKTRWDYQPRKNRDFLLAPLARLLGSVVWEFRPKHLRPAPVQEEAETATETLEEFETAPSESVDRSKRGR